MRSTHIHFDSSRLPLENRLNAFAQFSDASPGKILSSHALSPLSSENPEIHTAKRLFGDEICLATTSSTGYRSEYERGSLADNEVLPFSMGFVREGCCQIDGTRSRNTLSAGDVYVSTLRSNKLIVGQSVITRVLLTGDTALQSAKTNERLIVLGGSTPMGKVLAAAISAVEDTLAAAGDARMDKTVSSIAKQVARRALEADTITVGLTSKEKTRERVRDFVIENLSDTSLSPQTMASFLGMSRAAAYRAFVDDGGIMSFITGVRLEVACSLLGSGQRGNTRISEVAQLCGFRSPSHFSSSFKRAYGRAPSALREDPSA